jgi:hypothetical protein
MKKILNQNLVIKLFLVFFAVFGILSILSIGTLLKVIYKGKNIETDSKQKTVEVIDPQSEPTIVINKFINYFYNSNLADAYNLLSSDGKATVKGEQHLASYLGILTEIPEKVSVDKINYDSGITILRTSIKYKETVLKREFGLTIENKSWRIDYVKGIRIFAAETDVSKWLKISHPEITIKYPNNWRIVKNSQTQIILQPVQGYNTATMVRVDIQKGLAFSEVINTLSCKKVANAACYFSDINNLGFNTLDTQYTKDGITVKAVLLATEGKGNVYVISTNYVKDEEEKVLTTINSIISTITI